MSPVSNATSQINKTLPTNLGTLGGNEALMRKAEALEGTNRVTIVQKRAVERDYRLELGVLGAYGSNGNTYITTQQTGFLLDFHINPRFSIGARFNDITSKLTSEGVRLFETARDRGVNYSIPEIDYPLESRFLTLTYYPLYGKINLLDWTVIQFDLYTSLGMGETTLKSGASPTGNLTLGLAFWLHRHITSRMELSYETYEDRLYTGPRQLNNYSASFGMGFLL
jgi:outer membrane beta-barrel protein